LKRFNSVALGLLGYGMLLYGVVLVSVTADLTKDVNIAAWSMFVVLAILLSLGLQPASPELIAKRKADKAKADREWDYQRRHRSHHSSGSDGGGFFGGFDGGDGGSDGGCGGGDGGGGCGGD
jgi:uncharacterized membrane protein YgcG